MRSSRRGCNTNTVNDNKESIFNVEKLLLTSGRTEFLNPFKDQSTRDTPKAETQDQACQ